MSALVRSRGADDARWLFALFALLFALSLILHQLWWDGFEVLSPHFAVVLAAVWCALRPTSVARFLIMVAAEVVSVALDMPEVGSHTLLVLVSGASVLAFAGWTAFRARRLPDADALFEGMAPFLRAQLLLVYAAAALAKMNTGFFDGATSCAASMSGAIVWFYPLLIEGSWLVAPAIWGTVLVEVSLPVLLAVRRTRLAGLAVGAGFHTLLALAGNVPFSALALALYVAFLPADAPGRLRTLAAERPGITRWTERAARAARSRAALPLAAAAWVVAAVVFTYEPRAGAALISHGTRLVFLVTVLSGATLVVFLARAGRWRCAGGPRGLGHPVFAAGLLILVANALTPYLGLKTESSFTMFSNLQTESGRWNHALIPEAMRVFGYQDELVRITDSNDRALEARTRGGTRLVRFELERYVRMHPGTKATYASAAAPGATKYPTEAGRAALSAAPILDRIVKFRDVRRPERNGC